MNPRYMIPIASLLLGSACVHATPLPIPVSEAVFVRVTHRTGCSRGARCAGAWPERTVDGLVAWLDPDTLVVYDSWASPQVTIPVAHITKLEICRGQEECAHTARKDASVALLNVGLGALFGLAFEDVRSKTTWTEPELVEAAAGGAAAGAAISADRRTGDPLWEEVTVEQLFEELRLKRKLKEELAEPADARGLTSGAAGAA